MSVDSSMFWSIVQGDLDQFFGGRVSIFTLTVNLGQAPQFVENRLNVSNCVRGSVVNLLAYY